jgi:hypothetical protein
MRGTRQARVLEFDHAASPTPCLNSAGDRAPYSTACSRPARAASARGARLVPSRRTRRRREPGLPASRAASPRGVLNSPLDSPPLPSRLRPPRRSRRPRRLGADLVLELASHRSERAGSHRLEPRRVASPRTAPGRIARSAPGRIASNRAGSHRLEPRRLALRHLEPCRLAPPRTASARLAPPRTVSLAPPRTASIRVARTAVAALRTAALSSPLLSSPLLILALRLAVRVGRGAAARARARRASPRTAPARLGPRRHARTAGSRA